MVGSLSWMCSPAAQDKATAPPGPQAQLSTCSSTVTSAEHHVSKTPAEAVPASAAARRCAAAARPAATSKACGTTEGTTQHRLSCLNRNLSRESGLPTAATYTGWRSPGNNHSSLGHALRQGLGRLACRPGCTPPHCLAAPSSALLRRPPCCCRRQRGRWVSGSGGGRVGRRCGEAAASMCGRPLALHGQRRLMGKGRNRVREQSPRLTWCSPALLDALEPVWMCLGAQSAVRGRRTEAGGDGSCSSCRQESLRACCLGSGRRAAAMSTCESSQGRFGARGFFERSRANAPPCRR